MPRARKLDPDTALEAALGVFWRKGFEGASYADLVEATGAERPALYALFGNKQALFMRALERYDTHYGKYVGEAIALPTARQVAVRFLEGAVELSTRFPDRLGCLGVNGALAASDDAEEARLALIDWRSTGQVALRDRFAHAIEAGDLPKDAQPTVLAGFLLAMAHGLAVQAKAEFPRDVLTAIVDQALQGWPRSDELKIDDR